VLPLSSSFPSQNKDGGSSVENFPDNKVGVEIISAADKTDGPSEIILGTDGSGQKPVTQRSESSSASISVVAHYSQTNSRGVGRGSGLDFDKEEHDPNYRDESVHDSEEIGFSGFEDGNTSDWSDCYQQKFYIDYFNRFSDGDVGDVARGRGSSLDRSARSFARGRGSFSIGDGRGFARGRSSPSVGVGRGFDRGRGSLPAGDRAIVFQGFGRPNHDGFWNGGERSYGFHEGEKRAYWTGGGLCLGTMPDLGYQPDTISGEEDNTDLSTTLRLVYYPDTTSGRGRG
jgi:hypothetical protein